MIVLHCWRVMTRHVRTIIDPPGFGDGQTARFHPERGLKDQGERMVECCEFFSGVWSGGPGLMNPEVVRKTVQQALVAGPAQLFPRRHGEPIVTRQRLIVARNQSDSIVVGGNEHPPVKIVFVRQVQEEVNLSAFVLGWPGNVAANVSGSCGHKMSALLDDPNRNSTTTEAADHAEAPVVRTHDQRAAGSGLDAGAKIRAMQRLRKRGCS